MTTVVKTEYEITNKQKYPSPQQMNKQNEPESQTREAPPAWILEVSSQVFEFYWFQVQQCFHFYLKTFTKLFSFTRKKYYFGIFFPQTHENWLISMALTSSQIFSTTYLNDTLPLISALCSLITTK